MSEGGTLFGVRIGPHPSAARAINAQRQQALAPEQRAADPSSLERVIERGRQRDAVQRARNEFRAGGE